MTERRLRARHRPKTPKTNGRKVKKKRIEV